MFNRFKSTTKYFGDSTYDYLIVGLGNPGEKYELTRHNAGFLFIDLLARKYGGNVNKVKFKSLIGEVQINGKRCLLLKPQTYMNESGLAVVEAVNFYKFKPEQILVAFDDISLDVGNIRIRRKGSDGGHNGIKNIIYLTGTDSYKRIKIGVGKKPHPKYDLAAWVLSKFRDEEKEDLFKALENSVKAAEFIVDDNIDLAMQNFN